MLLYNSFLFTVKQSTILHVHIFISMFIATLLGGNKMKSWRSLDDIMVEKGFVNTY